MGRLDDKVVVITGAAGGIGREAALLFSEEGAKICVADVVEEQGEQTAAECRDAFFQKVDVTSSESVQEMYRATAERYGTLLMASLAADRRNRISERACAAPY